MLFARPRCGMPDHWRVVCTRGRFLEPCHYGKCQTLLEGNASAKRRFQKLPAESLPLSFGVNGHNREILGNIGKQARGLRFRKLDDPIIIRAAFRIERLLQEPYFVRQKLDGRRLRQPHGNSVSRLGKMETTTQVFPFLYRVREISL